MTAQLPDSITGMSLPMRLDSDPPPQDLPRLRRPISAESIIADTKAWYGLYSQTRLHTRLFYRRIPTLVSTVPLATDMQWQEGGLPLLWETMIFADGLGPNLAQWRYSTRAAAYAGHARIVNAIRAARTPPRRKRPAAVTSGWPKPSNPNG